MLKIELDSSDIYAAIEVYLKNKYSIELHDNDVVFSDKENELILNSYMYISSNTDIKAEIYLESCE